MASLCLPSSSASRASCGVVGQHQCFPGQGTGRKQWLYVRVQLPAEPCGSLRAAKEALVGLHAPKCYTELALTCLLDMVSQLTATLGAPPWVNVKEAAACTPQTSSCGKYLGGSSHVTSCQSDSSLVGMSWGSGRQKVLHPTSCPLGTSHTGTPGLPQGPEYADAFSKPEILSPKSS